MEVSIFERDGETWTRFKIKAKELNIYVGLIKKYVDVTNPVKKNSRFVYFECKGDLLNRKKDK